MTARTGPIAIRYVPIPTPLGQLYVAYRDRTVCCAALGSSARSFEQACARELRIRPIRDGRPPNWLAKQVMDHVTGRRRFSAPMDLSTLTPFQRLVLKKVREIPRGEVRSYQWVAREIGSDRAVRAVGTALARNPIPLLIPCHRVVRSDGRVGHYTGGGPKFKANLLAFEGVDLKGLARLATQRIRFVETGYLPRAND